MKTMKQTGDRILLTSDCFGTIVDTEYNHDSNQFEGLAVSDEATLVSVFKLFKNGSYKAVKAYEYRDDNNHLYPHTSNPQQVRLGQI